MGNQTIKFNDFISNKKTKDKKVPLVAILGLDKDLRKQLFISIVASNSFPQINTSNQFEFPYNDNNDKQKPIKDFLIRQFDKDIDNQLKNVKQSYSPCAWIFALKSSEQISDAIISQLISIQVKYKLVVIQGKKNDTTEQNLKKIVDLQIHYLSESHKSNELDFFFDKLSNDYSSLTQ